VIRCEPFLKNGQGLRRRRTGIQERLGEGLELGRLTCATAMAGVVTLLCWLRGEPSENCTTRRRDEKDLISRMALSAGAEISEKRKY
jgi:hypothetical protein